ncbi:MAG: HD domain-containing protein [Candidatus Aminicenantales bacterium]
MREELLSLMPEFHLIEDPDLREKTIRVWEEAIERGGWTVADLLEMPFTLLIEKTSVNILAHTRAVTLSALRIAETLLDLHGDKIRIHKDHLLSGALLHDVGKLFEVTKAQGTFRKSPDGALLRHPISGAAFADRLGLPMEVLHIIACHSREGDGARKTVEAVIVNHADFVNFDAWKL